MALQREIKDKSARLQALQAKSSGVQEVSEFADNDIRTMLFSIIISFNMFHWPLNDQV